MNLIESLLAEIEQEAANTRRVLERVPEEHFDWRPHEKSWTMAQLASHIAETPSWVGGIMSVDEMDLQGPMDYKPFVAKSHEELLRKFD